MCTSSWLNAVTDVGVRNTAENIVVGTVVSNVAGNVAGNVGGTGVDVVGGADGIALVGCMPNSRRQDSNCSFLHNN